MLWSGEWVIWKFARSALVLSGQEKSQVHAVLLALKGHSCRWVGRHDLLLAATGSKRLTGHRLFSDAGPANMQGDSGVLVQVACSLEVETHCPEASQVQVHFVFVHLQAQFEFTGVYVLLFPGVSIRFSWGGLFVLLSVSRSKWICAFAMWARSSFTRISMYGGVTS